MLKMVEQVLTSVTPLKYRRMKLLHQKHSCTDSVYNKKYYEKWKTYQSKIYSKYHSKLVSGAECSQSIEVQ